MKKYLVGLLFLAAVLNAFAQKVRLNTWVERNIDSLRKIGVDTIVYYHAYCGECEVLEKPINIADTSEKKHDCEIDNSWTQIANVIVYQQNNTFITLTFNCNYPPLKAELKTCKSIPYFISIIPTLNRRDKMQQQMFKRGKFNPPVTVDGGYEETWIYLNGKKQHIYLQENQKTDKAWRSFFLDR